LKATFGIRDRLQLLAILPSEGNITLVRIMDDLARELSFTEDEIAAVGLASVTDASGSRWSWDDAKEQPKEVSIGPRAWTAIEDHLKRLSDQGKLPRACVGLWDRFVTPDEPKSGLAVVGE
jgi:hypothetical protein